MHPADHLSHSEYAHKRNGVPVLLGSRAGPADRRVAERQPKGVIVRNHIADLSIILTTAFLAAAVFGLIALVIAAVLGLAIKGARAVMK